MIVGACIARPLTGNIFFLSKIGVIGTLAFAGDREVIPLLGEMGVAQKGCRRAKVSPTTVKEWLAVLEMSAPSVTA